MTFDYEARASALRRKGLLVAIGMVAIPLSIQMPARAASIPDQVQKPAMPMDPRVETLHNFFKKLDCPVAGMAEDFIRVADENHLDWRLLPSIAIVESGGGKAYRNNNIFGWNGGKQAFESILSGLETVAAKLGQSPLYRAYDSFGKLRTYNPNSEYANSVMALMNRISPMISSRTTEMQPRAALSFGRMFAAVRN